MNNADKLTEAKLMAIENMFAQYRKACLDTFSCMPTDYAYAQHTLQAIHNAEIAEELRQHESNLLTRDEKPDDVR